MCGIFGLMVNNRSGFTARSFRTTLNNLYTLSESRGKEAAGLALLSDETIQVYKRPVSASEMIEERRYNEILTTTLRSANGTKGGTLRRPLVAIGHSRLVTHGRQENHFNNQPVIKDGLVAIHNGIIVNHDVLWAENPTLKRSFDIDTEVMLSLIRRAYAEGQTLTSAVREAFRQIVGTASVAMMFDDTNHLVLATNNGSLYVCSNADGTAHVFASEQYILQMLLKKPHLRDVFGGSEIKPVRPGFGLLLDVETMNLQWFSLEQDDPAAVEAKRAERRIVDVPEQGTDRHARPAESAPDPGGLIAHVHVPSEFHTHIERVRKGVERLRRCTRCVLPETMPFIEFDEHGVCNYCRSYTPIGEMGHDTLMKAVEPYRKSNGDPDVIVTFSGGRDSSYGLHYAKTELGMNPVAYTYDWGMVTDLARRNQARICGKLGVEHILVSADITRKRENIRKNVSAWLKRPHLGTVPLFMAGDKQYFYFANKLMEQTGVKLVLLFENLLETTNFKSGYCGIPPKFDSDHEHTYTLSVFDKIRLASFYGMEYLLNPAYINSSLFDTVHAFFSYYMIPHDYVNMYQYIRWDEEEIERVLLDGYDWETATDTRTTWRIGDGTAPFYNYIYYVVSGFTENDTFRSNQIREGMITRERAMATMQEDNVPRYDSIKWYCDTIGIDFETTIAAINRIPKRFTL